MKGIKFVKVDRVMEIDPERKYLLSDFKIEIAPNCVSTKAGKLVFGLSNLGEKGEKGISFRSFYKSSNSHRRFYWVPPGTRSISFPEFVETPSGFDYGEIYFHNANGGYRGTEKLPGQGVSSILSMDVLNRVAVA